MKRPARADLARLALLIIALLVLAAMLSLAFAAAGRTGRQSTAAGTGLVGLGMAAAGMHAPLGLSCSSDPGMVTVRAGSGRVTEMLPSGPPACASSSASSRGTSVTHSPPPGPKS